MAYTFFDYFAVRFIYNLLIISQESDATLRL